MNKEVLEIIDFHSKETKFAENLKELMDILQSRITILETKQIEDDSLFYDESNDVLYQYDDADDADDVLRDVIQPIMFKILKQEVKIETTRLKMGDSKNNFHYYDGLEHNILYTLNQHEIKIKIQVCIENYDEKMIVYSDVKIDNWYHCVLSNCTMLDDALKYYPEKTEGTKMLLETEADLFYKEFDIEQNYMNSKYFIDDFMYIFKGRVANYLGLYYDE